MRFLLLLTILFTSYQLTASHIGDGEMFYKYIGDQPGYNAGDYLVFVKTKGCPGNIFSFPLYAYHFGDTSRLAKSAHLRLIGPSNTLSHFLRKQLNDYGFWPTDTQRNMFNYCWKPQDFLQGCGRLGSQVEGRYYAIINLHRKSKYILRACTGSGIQPDNTGYVPTLSLEVTLDNRLGHNNSARILVPMNINSCASSDTLQLSFTAFDGDGDSLRYSLHPRGLFLGCRKPNAMGYNAGLSKAKPFYTNYLKVDANKGILYHVNSRPGTYLIDLLVLEYRFSTAYTSLGGYYLVGSTHRRLLFTVDSNCSTVGQAGRLHFITFDPEKLEMKAQISIDSVSADALKLHRQQKMVDHRFVDTARQYALFDSTAPIFFSSPFKYYLSGTDFCGRGHKRSSIHQNIAVSHQVNSNGVAVNWTPYQGKVIQSYQIYGVNEDRSNFQLLAQVPANQLKANLAVNDSLYAYYFVEGVLQDSSLLFASYPYQGPLGASKNARYVSLERITLPAYRLYPNPVQTQLQLEGSDLKNRRYELLQSDGRIMQRGVLPEKKNQLDLRTLSPGSYLLKIEGHQPQRLIKH